MENKNGNIGRGSTGVAFLVGAMAGGIAALLLAPQTGAQMRGRIKQGARNIQKRGKHLAHNMQDRAGDVKGAVVEARTAYRGEMDKRHASPRPAILETVERT